MGRAQILFGLGANCLQRLRHLIWDSMGHFQQEFIWRAAQDTVIRQNIGWEVFGIGREQLIGLPVDRCV